ncbi:MAG: S-layer homology domain-containing protein [Candidatus Gracilibacteria bacterium]|jgi:lactocepin
MIKKFPLIILFFLALSTPVFAATFPDVLENHENFAAIEYLREKGIINGYPDGNFGPDNPVNRAEATKIITGAFAIPTDGEYEILFPDVLDSAWYFKYVMGAREAGLINGYEDGKFKPVNTVNLAESMKILLLASGPDFDPEQQDVEGKIFNDVDNAAWYAPYVSYGKDKNILMADDDGNIVSWQNMTRGKFAEIVYRMMIVKENEFKPFNMSTNWPYYESKKLPFKMKFENKNWLLIENTNEVVFFKPDRDYGQFSPTRVYPDSAIIRVTLDPNDGGRGQTDYFENIKAAFPGATYTSFTLSNFPAMEVLYPAARTVDWYIYLDSGKVLVVYTEYGDNIKNPQIPDIIKNMLKTLEYQELPGIDYDEIMATILSNILVEGKGMEMFALVPDEIIIETDTVGVGTGPVDYYYSAVLNHTFKYERSSDTILAKSAGKTSSF